MELPDDYPVVGLLASLLAFQYFLSNFAVMMRARGQTFNKDFMSQFQSEHEDGYKKHNQTVPKIDFLGYPDTGNGLYSQKFTYEQWFQFNSKKRSYLNTLELLTPTISWLLIGGLHFPWAASFGGLFFLSGRIMYLVGYFKKPEAKGMGQMISLISMLWLFVAAVIACA